MMSNSIVLLGDSIFDNGPYVIGQPCVTEQLQEIAPDGVEVTMLAVDGNYVSDVITQLRELPQHATHLFISAGGNDILSCREMLLEDFLTSEDLFEKWSRIQAEFRKNYRYMLENVTALDRHAAVCTIYDAIPDLEAVEVTALSLFNDVIVSEAVRAGLPVVDLRQVCTMPTDYSDMSVIEPSFEGGRKISNALLRVYEEHDYASKATVIYK